MIVIEGLVSKNQQKATSAASSKMISNFFNPPMTAYLYKQWSERVLCKPVYNTAYT